MVLRDTIHAVLEVTVLASLQTVTVIPTVVFEGTAAVISVSPALQVCLCTCVYGIGYNTSCIVGDFA